MAHMASRTSIPEKFSQCAKQLGSFWLAAEDVAYNKYCAESLQSKCTKEYSWCSGELGWYKAAYCEAGAASAEGGPEATSLMLTIPPQCS